jgi:hypothetical protein
VWSQAVVALEPWLQGTASVQVVVVAGGVGPFGLQGLDEEFETLPLVPGPVGTGADRRRWPSGRGSGSRHW